MIFHGGRDLDSVVTQRSHFRSTAVESLYNRVCVCERERAIWEMKMLISFFFFSH
jgi:hypothetical protein